MPERARSPRSVLVAAAVVALTLESLRGVSASLTWYLRDTVGIPTLNLIPIVLAPFVIAAAVPLLARRLGARGALFGAINVLAITRLAAQLIDVPSADLVLLVLAAGAGVGALPLLLRLGRPTLLGGVLLGVTLDTALRGLGRSLDLGFRDDTTAQALVMVLTLGAAWTVAGVDADDGTPDPDGRRVAADGGAAGRAARGAGASGGPGVADRGRAAGRGARGGRGASLALLGLGPWLFAQALVLQAQGWTSEAGGVSAGHAMVRIALLNVVALALVVRLGHSRPARLGGVVVVAVSLVVGEASAAVFNVASILGLAGSGLALAALVPDRAADTDARGAGGDDTDARDARDDDRNARDDDRNARGAGGDDTDARDAVAPALIGGALVFLVLGLVYYLPLDLDLGFGLPTVRHVGAGLLVLAGLAGARGAVVTTSDDAAPRTLPSWLVPTGAALVALPLIGALGLWLGDARPADARPADARPADAGTEGVLTVLTFNVHSAFDVDGRMDVDAIAATIDATGADVVALQEVDRGRLLNAGTDVLTLLADDLGFAHVAFHPTTDPVWGNAILSRHPLGAVETGLLPRAGTPMQRGFVAAVVAAPGGEVLVINTHLQHVADADVAEVDPERDVLDVHRAQLGALLDAWDGRAPAVLVGDFNARPGWQQMVEVLAAGWVDSWAEAGVGPGFTFPSDDPDERIDWVLHTPDLVATRAENTTGTASDHLGVIVELRHR